MPVLIDTLQQSRRLEAAGVPARQAEAFTGFLVDALAELPTRAESQAESRLMRTEWKAECALLRHEIRDGLEKLRQDTSAEIQQLRNDTMTEIRVLRVEFVAKFRLLHWMLASLGAGIATLMAGVVAVLVKLYA